MCVPLSYRILTSQSENKYYCAEPMESVLDLKMFPHLLIKFVFSSFPSKPWHVQPCRCPSSQETASGLDLERSGRFSAFSKLEGNRVLTSFSLASRHQERHLLLKNIIVNLNQTLGNNSFLMKAISCHVLSGLFVNATSMSSLSHI